MYFEQVLNDFLGIIQKCFISFEIQGYQGVYNPKKVL